MHRAGRANDFWQVALPQRSRVSKVTVIVTGSRPAKVSCSAAAPGCAYHYNATWMFCAVGLRTHRAGNRILGPATGPRAAGTETCRAKWRCSVAGIHP